MNHSRFVSWNFWVVERAAFPQMYMDVVVVSREQALRVGQQYKKSFDKHLQWLLWLGSPSILIG